MEPAAAFLLAASLSVAQRVRDALVRHQALIWSNGRVLAARISEADLRPIIALIAEEPEVHVYSGSFPDDVLAALPAATQMMIKAQQQPEQKRRASAGGISWDATGFEAPRHLKKQGA